MKKWADAKKIKSSDIDYAAKEWKKNSSDYSFRESRLYDVYINGEPYPPKAICAIAYEKATKKPLEPSEFAGAKDGYWHQILKNLGYTIAKKHSKAALIAQTDALLSLPYDELLEKAKESSSFQPIRKSITASTFVRSPYVRALSLRRANGICERCMKPAPFIKRSTEQPYLEVHHIKPLSQGGADHISNTKALCPNCHCEEHDILGLQDWEE